jgi:Uma2 family endonuclease
MTALSNAPARMTSDAFLAWVGNGRYQLVDGYVEAMAPASTTHGRIQANLAFVIEGHLRRKKGPCWVAVEPGVQPQLKAKSNVRVPDLGVTCKPNVANQQVLPDPLLLIEILSPSNGKDAESNIFAYTTIPSAQELVIVHSEAVKVEVFRRGPDGHWLFEPETTEGEGTVTFASIGAAFAIADIYAGTHLIADKQ